MIAIVHKTRSFLLENKFIVVALLVASFLLLFNLDNGALWLDEGVSAQLAKNILKYGYPKAWDGHNMVTILNGTEFDSNFLWVYQPWLPLYMIAGCFAVFGVNTFGARFPFAVMGILAVLAFHFLSRRVLRREEMARLATICLLCSIPFILWSRQCHWYAPVILFSILIVLTFLWFLDKPGIGAGLAFVLSSSGLFYSNFMYLPGLTIALIVFTLWMRNRKVFIRLIWCEVAVLLIASPWIVYPMRVFGQSTHCLFPGLNAGVGAALQNLSIYFWKINTFFMPLIGLLLGWLVCFFLWGKGKSENNFELPDKRKMLILIVTFQLLLVLPFYPYPWALARWLMSSLPFYLLLTVLILGRIIAYQRVAGYALTVLILFTNVVHVFPYSVIKWLNIPPSLVEPIVKSPHSASTFYYPSLYGYINYEQCFRSYVYEYVTGLFHDYKGRTMAVADYLNQHGQMNDKVLVQTLEAEPLMFYTDFKIVNRLNPAEEDTEMGGAFQIHGPNAKKYWQLTQAGYNDIDWIVTGRYAFINMEIWSEFNETDFEKIPIDAPDIFFDSNPDIDGGHYFRTLKEAPGFYLYHRKS